MLLSELKDNQIQEYLNYQVLLAGGIKQMTFTDEVKLLAVKVTGACELKAELDERDLVGEVKVGKDTYRLTGVAPSGTCFFDKEIVHMPKVSKPSFITDEDLPF